MVGSTTLLGALARQWVVHDLGPTTDRDLWLIEGLSVLAQCRALEQAGQAARCRGLLQARRDRVDSCRISADHGPVGPRLDRRLGVVGAPLRPPRIRMGARPLVIDAMRLLVGSKVTFESLRRVAASYRGQSLSTQSFVLQAQAAGRDLRSFFAWWVFATPQHPRLQPQWETGRQDDGKWTSWVPSPCPPDATTTRSRPRPDRRSDHARKRDRLIQRLVQGWRGPHRDT